MQASRVAAARVCRQAPRVPRVPRVQPAHCVHARTLATTARRLASEDNRHDMMSPVLPPGFEKLGESPEALAALNQLMEALQRQGIDLSSGQRPTMKQMYALATNPDVRECASRGT